jgi:hypothetical protein
MALTPRQTYYFFYIIFLGISLCISFGLSLAACSGNLKLEALEGEDDEIRKLLQEGHEPQSDMRVQKKAIIQAYDALSAKDYQTVWDQYLATATKHYFDVVGDGHNKSGFEIFSSGSIKDELDPNKLKAVDMLDWLLIKDMRKILLEIKGLPTPRSEINEAILYIADSEGNFKEIHLLFENNKWRIKKLDME